MPKPRPKLKIGLVLDDTLDTPDGVQQYVLAIGKWLHDNGHDVHYLVGKTSRSDIANVHSLSRNIQVRFNRNRLSIPLPVSKSRLGKLLADQNYDILHVQMPYSPMLGSKVVAGAPPGTAIIGTFHVAPHSRSVYAANKLLGVALRRTISRFDRVISVSDQAAKLAKAAYHVDSLVLPNTIDLSPFFDAKPALKDNQYNLLFIGRLVERKGCAHLLQAAAYIYENHLLEAGSWHLTVGGDGPLKSNLQKFVAVNNLKSYVSFSGFITEETKAGYLAGADLAIYPSTGGESFGIVLLEAMAAGKGRVLAGNNPGYASVLAKHPENLFNPYDHKQLAMLIVRSLKDKAGQKAARNWQKKLAAGYDIRVIGPKLLDIYMSSLHGSQR